jgi:hypothetical protein
MTFDEWWEEHNAANPYPVREPRKEIARAAWEAAKMDTEEEIHRRPWIDRGGG